MTRTTRLVYALTATAAFAAWLYFAGEALWS